MAEKHGAHDGAHHIIPLETYLKIFGALIFLTVVTVAVAKPVTGVSFGAFSTVIAFGIASIKASLVLGYFMHLKYDNMMNRVIIGAGVFFLIVFWFFSAADIMTRITESSAL